MKIINYIFLYFLLAGSTVFAQDEVWTLDMCLDTAVENNAAIKQVELDANLARIVQQTSRYAFTPTAEVSANHSFNFGRILNPVSNDFIQTSGQNSGFSGYASLSLFEGMARYYTVQKSDIQYNAQELNKKVVIRNTKLQVLTFYLQVLVNAEMVKLSDSHLAYSAKQEERMLLLIESGNKVVGDLIEIKSQMGEDKLSKLKAENERKMSYQRLIQILQIEHETNFNVDTSFSILSDTNVFVQIDDLPEVELKNIELKEALINKRIQKADYYPSLVMSGGIGTTYSNNYYEEDPNDPSIIFVPAFDKQLNTNLYQTIGFSISIPIYNKNITKNNVQRAEIEIQKAELEIERVKWELVKTIEQLTTDIENARAELNASIEFINLAELDFENAQKKHEQGLIDYSVLLGKKDRLFDAQSKFIQNKYNYYFKARIKALYNE